MKSILDLGRNLSSCPICWQNFIRAFNEEWWNDSENTHSGSPTKHFDDANVELQDKWNAKLNGKGWDCTPVAMEFETEQAKLVFILRWS